MPSSWSQMPKRIFWSQILKLLTKTSSASHNPIGSGSEPQNFHNHWNPQSSRDQILHIHTPHPEKLHKKQPILPNSNRASKSHKNPDRKNTNFHLKSPNHNHNKNQQPNGFQNQNPILSTPTKTKNKPRKGIPQKTERLITEFENGEACESI